jgi:glycosyltransferase A (GT-A) superfamily protein (DUF2064 family)
VHILVLAKEPVAGRVKTRLCPPLEHAEAALVAEAALADTLETVARCGATRRILALDGRPGPWLPEGFQIVPQRGDGLAERLASAWADAGGPGLQIGMDTPQVTPALLEAAMHELDDSAADGKRRALAERPQRAVLGLALDGGWWGIGLTRAAPEVFAGVPMSTASTGAAQAARLRALGWSVGELPVLRDIDTVEDLAAVAAGLPGSRTAAAATAVGVLGTAAAATAAGVLGTAAAKTAATACGAATVRGTAEDKTAATALGAATVLGADSVGAAGVGTAGAHRRRPGFVAAGEQR